MALRLLLAARKSRKAGDDGVERQDYRARTWAEREGHTIVGAPADIKSGTTPPWKRKNLKPWMTDPTMMAMYDAILVSDTDRLSRGTDADFHYIEHWMYENGKKIIVADGPQFPAREGPMGESDRYQWIAQKRAARTYWEAVRDKHADTREVIKANGSAIGLAPFGYTITGAKLHKTFTVDTVTGPLALEAFTRISQGHTATDVAVWLTEQTGKLWRVKRVTDMIQRRTYLGSRDGHEFQALVTQEMFDQANAALATRSFKHKDQGGRRTVHGYSSLIYCECGSKLTYHYTGRGNEKYRCARGRSGDVTEAKCTFSAPNYSEVNNLVDAFMSKMQTPQFVMVTTGGDHGRQMELSALQSEMQAALAKMDMATVTRLAGSISALQGMQPEPVRMELRETGRTYSTVWSEGDLTDQRALLGRLANRLVVKQENGAWVVTLGQMVDAIQPSAEMG